MRPPPALVALSPGDLGAGGLRDFLLRVRAAIGGGLRGVLLREPLLNDADWMRVFRELARLREETPDLWLAGHDRVHLTWLVGGDAVHLGFRSLSPELVRERFPSLSESGALTVGLSTHAADDERGWEAADYLFHGPVNDTPSKRGLLDPIGCDGLARGVARAGPPVWAIGGLTPDDLEGVREAGAKGFAVLGGILPSDDPRGATERYLRAWGGP